MYVAINFAPPFDRCFGGLFVVGLIDYALALEFIIVCSNPSFSRCSHMMSVALIAQVRILQSLNHPNVVRYYDVFEGDGRVYLLMQLVEGATLQEVVESESEKSHRFTEERLWHVFIQLCSALR